MATQDWLGPPQHPGESTPASPLPAPIRGYELRPLAVGEILDRVFSLYRAHFWLLVGLSAVSAGVSVAVAILRLVFLHFSPLKITSPGSAGVSYIIFNSAIAFVQGGAYLIAYSLTLAATTSAVNALYLGEPTSMGIALRTARRLWLRCIGITLWQGWSAAWLAILLLITTLLIPLIPGIRGLGAVGPALGLFLGILVGTVYGVIAYLRNSLAVPAEVVEGLGVRAAMRRSKNLATGRIGRIFLLFLLMYALMLVTAVITVPLALVIAKSPAAEHFVAQGIVLAVNFMSTSLVGPIAAIGLCLFYFDERVRRDGFDIEVLLRDASISSPPPAPDIAAGPSDDTHITQEQN
jgi:ABC-type multidrug transport system fused ATPase/permease subunit